MTASHAPLGSAAICNGKVPRGVIEPAGVTRHPLGSIVPNEAVTIADETLPTAIVTTNARTRAVRITRINCAKNVREPSHSIQEPGIRCTFAGSAATAMSDSTLRTAGSSGPARPTDYLANERTFLAYIRTSLAVMAFGFVIARFTIFLRAIPAAQGVRLPPAGTSEGLGLAFAIFGCLLAVLGVWRFLTANRDLDRDQFKARPLGDVIVGVATVLMGVAVVLSLIRVF